MGGYERDMSVIPGTHAWQLAPGVTGTLQKSLPAELNQGVIAKKSL